MEEGTVCGTCIFRGIEYVVTMTVGNGNLTMEVEDRLTADQWRGTFDSKYVEDLTHKTGNFKQFKIFVSMLESALNGSSEAVSLDLLTYSDLESLRNRKAGVPSKNVPSARPAALNTKRYLILTYTVQFDRIHYPLPLPFMGKPDPRSLQETIRELRQEINALQESTTQTHQSKGVTKLQRDYNELLQEKNELEAEFIEYKREIQHTSKGSAAKEVRILKGVVKNLEEELVEEKARNHRTSNKRNQECRKLSDEVNELRASERNLKVRVKSLVNELAVYKGRRSANSSLSSRTQHRTSFERPSRNNSRENSRVSYTSNGSNSTDRIKARSSSTERLKSRQSSTERARQYDREHQRNRSTSRDRLSEGRGVYMRDRSNSFGVNGPRSSRANSRDRVPVRSNSQERFRSNSHERFRSNSQERLRRRTPSPRGGVPKFDPTAFVREKERKRKEADLKKRRVARSRMNASLEKKSGSSPLSERHYNRNSSFGSHTSSVEYLTDNGAASDSSQASASRTLGRRRRGGSSGDGKSSARTSVQNGYIVSSPDVSFSKPMSDVPAEGKKVLASTPDRKARNKAFSAGAGAGKENLPSDAPGSDFYERSNEITEIDARLNRLQLFMKATMP